MSDCCATLPSAEAEAADVSGRYPSHQDQLHRLSKIEGQLKGVRRMIEERRYCIDIIGQIRAVVGALEKVEMGVLETHVQHCVKDAITAQDSEQLQEKIDEIVTVLAKMQ